MEERQVTVEGHARALPDPFIVIAAQNPVEYEGTYPLPEAQPDRFLLKPHVGYPTAQPEHAVLVRHHEGMDPHALPSPPRPVATAADTLAAPPPHNAERAAPPVIASLVALPPATRAEPSLSLTAPPTRTS